MNLNKKKILVCGAGGFIGGHLVKDLLKDGHAVTCADSKPYDYWFQHFKECENYSLDLKNYDNLQLTRGAFLCDIDISDDGINIICKNLFGRHCTFKMNEILLFQKISDDEQVILSALKYLQK